MRSLIAKRLKGTGLPLPQILPIVAQLLSDWQSTPPLRYAGLPPIEIELSEAGISEYMTWLRQAWDLGIPKSFILSSRDYKPELVTYIKTSDFSKIESIECSSYFNFPDSNFPEEKLELNATIDSIAQLCLNFNCYNAYFYDENIREFLLYHYNLLHPSKFDTRYVPLGVLWINFWDKTQVETIGIEKIRNAPWVKIIELSEGGMILIATELPTDSQNQQHLTRLDAIASQLHLREIQERYLLSKPSWETFN